MLRYLITNLQLLPWLSHHQRKIHQNVHSSQSLSLVMRTHTLHEGISYHPSHSDVIGNKYFPWKDLGERTSKPSISPSCSPEVLPEHAFQRVESFFRLLEYLAFLLGLDFLSAFRGSKLEELIKWPKPWSLWDGKNSIRCSLISTFKDQELENVSPLRWAITKIKPRYLKFHP